ncbi:hypothetical protein SIID45300_00582 [Candidatus Magnetaquicoccaceae bacterium FCR-1]|uniref:Uncharacterized protein n=1 Tax=Candidatus Magnetaquiglobus chichijimensis TaxID=3141448 RepID=A0ABQ0C5X2_9PROT
MSDGIAGREYPGTEMKLVWCPRIFGIFGFTCPRIYGISDFGDFRFPDFEILTIQTKSLEKSSVTSLCISEQFCKWNNFNI